MIELTARTFGDGTNQRLRGLLERTRAVIPNMVGGAAPDIVAAFRKQEAKLWDTQGASGQHGKWAALKPSYALRKAKLFAARPILYLSGRLRDSLAQDSEGAIVVTFPNAVFIGSSVPYAKPLAEGNAPLMGPRRAIDPTDRDVYEWVIAIEKHFGAQVSKIGWAGRFRKAMA